MHEELATSRQEIQALRRCIEDLRQQFGERERHRIEEQQTVITMHDEARAALECQYETLRMRAEDDWGRVQRGIMEQLHVAKDTLARTLPELVRHSERLEEEKAKLEEQNAWQARQIQQQAERLDALQRDLDVLRDGCATSGRGDSVEKLLSRVRGLGDTRLYARSAPSQLIKARAEHKPSNHGGFLRNHRLVSGMTEHDFPKGGVSANDADCWEESPSLRSEQTWHHRVQGSSPTLSLDSEGEESTTTASRRSSSRRGSGDQPETVSLETGWNGSPSRHSTVVNMTLERTSHRLDTLRARLKGVNGAL